MTAAHLDSRATDGFGLHTESQTKCVAVFDPVYPPDDDGDDFDPTDDGRDDGR